PPRCVTTATSPSYPSTLSLHDALPISHRQLRQHVAPLLGMLRLGKHVVASGDELTRRGEVPSSASGGVRRRREDQTEHETDAETDRKSTRLNSSHVSISYAVFCLKKKK